MKQYSSKIKDSKVIWYTATKARSRAPVLRLLRAVKCLNPKAIEALINSNRALRPEDIQEALSGIELDAPAFVFIDDFHFFRERLSDDMQNIVASHSNPNLHIIIITREITPVIKNACVISRADLRLPEKAMKIIFASKRAALPAATAAEIAELSRGCPAAVLAMADSYKHSGSIYGGELYAAIEKYIWRLLSAEQQHAVLCAALFNRFSTKSLRDMCGGRAIGLDFLTEMDLAEKKKGRLSLFPLIKWFALRRLSTSGLHDELCLRAARICYEEESYPEGFRLYISAGSFCEALNCPLHTLELTNIDDRPFYSILESHLCGDSSEMALSPHKLLECALIFIKSSRISSAQKLLQRLEKSGELPYQCAILTALMSYPFADTMADALEKIHSEAAAFTGLYKDILWGAISPFYVFTVRGGGSSNEILHEIKRFAAQWRRLTGGATGLAELAEAEYSFLHLELSEAGSKAEQACAWRPWRAKPRFPYQPAAYLRT